MLCGTILHEVRGKVKVATPGVQIGPTMLRRPGQSTAGSMGQCYAAKNMNRVSCQFRDGIHRLRNPFERIEDLASSPSLPRLRKNAPLRETPGGADPSAEEAVVDARRECLAAS